MISNLQNSGLQASERNNPSRRELDPSFLFSSVQKKKKKSIISIGTVLVIFLLIRCVESSVMDVQKPSPHQVTPVDSTKTLLESLEIVPQPLPWCQMYIQTLNKDNLVAMAITLDYFLRGSLNGIKFMTHSKIPFAHALCTIFFHGI